MTAAVLSPDRQAKLRTYRARRVSDRNNISAINVAPSHYAQPRYDVNDNDDASSKTSLQQSAALSRKQKRRQQLQKLRTENESLKKEKSRGVHIVHDVNIIDSSTSSTFSHDDTIAGLNDDQVQTLTHLHMMEGIGGGSASSSPSISNKTDAPILRTVSPDNTATPTLSSSQKALLLRRSMLAARQQAASECIKSEVQLAILASQRNRDNCSIGIAASSAVPSYSDFPRERVTVVSSSSNAMMNKLSKKLGSFLPFGNSNKAPKAPSKDETSNINWKNSVCNISSSEGPCSPTCSPTTTAKTKGGCTNTSIFSDEDNTTLNDTINTDSDDDDETVITQNTTRYKDTHTLLKEIRTAMRRCDVCTLCSLITKYDNIMDILGKQNFR